MGNGCRKPASATGEDALDLAEGIEQHEQPVVASVAPQPGDDPSQTYVRLMQPFLIAPADLSEDKMLTGMAQGREGSSVARMRKLSREIRELRQNLPVALSSSIFVRYDRKKPYFMKALITGPEDTPYDCGAFIFDIFFPDSYPNEPPHVLLRTTGGGTVRFNPNLYDTGKVCLSLLGTWSGSHACERWSSSKSSILQVLVSIQGLILVKYPYYNEPGRSEKSAPVTSPQVKFDTNGGYVVVRQHNLRWAIADSMKAPHPAFRDVIHRHFVLRAGYIRGLTQAWLQDPDLTTQLAAMFRECAMLVERHLLALPPLPADDTQPVVESAVVDVVETIMSLVCDSDAAPSVSNCPQHQPVLAATPAPSPMSLSMSVSMSTTPPSLSVKPVGRDVAVTATSIAFDDVDAAAGISADDTAADQADGLVDVAESVATIA